jgi:hypothetical protein
MGAISPGAALMWMLIMDASPTRYVFLLFDKNVNYDRRYRHYIDPVKDPDRHYASLQGMGARSCSQNVAQ